MEGMAALGELAQASCFYLCPLNSQHSSQRDPLNTSTHIIPLLETFL